MSMRHSFSILHSSFSIAFAALCAASLCVPAASGAFLDDYTVCEYISVTSEEQYINTGYDPGLTTDIQAHFEVPNYNSSNPLYWSRVEAGETSSFAFILQASANTTRKVRAYRLSAGSSNLESTLQDTWTARDIRLSTEYSDAGAVNTFTFNGQTADFPVNTLNGKLGLPLYIFRLNDKGTLYSGVKAVVGNKLYSFTILEGGTVVKDFLPCVRKSDGVAGLYDILEPDSTKAFYANAGTGGSFGYMAADASRPSFTSLRISDVTSSGATVTGLVKMLGEDATSADVWLVYTDGATTNSISLGAVTSAPASIQASLENLSDYTAYTCWFTATNNAPTPVGADSDQTDFVTYHDPRLGMVPGYTQCKCIIVTHADQYINTLCYPKYTTDVEAHFEVPHFNSLNPLYWVRGSFNSASFGFALPPNAGPTKTVRAYRLSNGGSPSNTTTLQNTVPTNILISTEYSGNTFTLNGETASFAARVTDSLNLALTLFALNDSGNFSNAKAVVGTKLYSFKIYEEGVPQKELVPCMRDADGVTGLYDLLETVPSKAFYSNAGSGGDFGFEAIDTDGTTLAVAGSPVQGGTPYPAYGVTNLEAGVAINAEMPQAAFTNYLNGEERQLLGWTLSVTRAGATTITTSTDLNRQRCSFTPQDGDYVTLTWRWTQDFYGARTLPDEYEAASTLEFTSEDGQRSAFVDTAYVPSLDDQIVISVNPTYVNGTRVLFCAREIYEQGSSAWPNLCVFSMNGNLSYYCGTGVRKENLGSLTAGQMTAIAIKGRGLYRDGAALDARFGETELEPAAALIIGKSNNTYDLASWRAYGIYNHFEGRVHAFKVWSQDGTPRVDLRPCTRKADGAAGFYDTVRGVFCPKRQNPLLSVSGDPTNMGNPTPYSYGSQRIDIHVDTYAKTYTAQVQSGEQTAIGGEAKYQVAGWELRKTTLEGVETVVSNDAGNAASCSFTTYFGDKLGLTWFFDVQYLKPAGPHMPQRYSEAEWIDFPGDTYILTDYVPHPDRIRMQVDFQLASTNLQSVFCSRDGVNNRCYTTLLYPPEGWSSTGLHFRVNDKWSNFLSTPPLGERLTLCTETNTVWIKDRTDVFAVEDFTRPFTEAGGPLMFGASYQSVQADGSLSFLGNYSTIRLFGAKVWESGVLVHNYLPCFDRLTGVSGLYDTVDGKFFPNAAGAHFISGRGVTGGLVIYIK